MQRKIKSELCANLGDKLWSGIATRADQRWVSRENP